MPFNHALRGTFACPHCGRDTPHPHTHAELEAYAEIKRYPGLLCQPGGIDGGSDYCGSCGRDMCIGKPHPFNTVCPVRKQRFLASIRSIPGRPAP